MLGVLNENIKITFFHINKTNKTFNRFLLPIQTRLFFGLFGTGSGEFHDSAHCTVITLKPRVFIAS